MSLNKSIALFLSVFLAHSVSGQNQILKLENFLNREIVKSVAHPDSLIPTGAAPYLSGDFDLSEVYGHQKDSMVHYYMFSKKLFSDHLIVIDKGGLKARIDPLFDWNWGYDFRDPTNYQDSVLLRRNTRGFRIEGSVGDKLSFITAFQENQSFEAAYLKNYVDSFGVMPSEGRVKAYEEVGFDYGFSFASLNYTPVEFLNIQFGHDRNFVGFGYRSLLLSDNSFFYPQLKVRLRSRDNKYSYTSAYAALHSLERKPRGEVPESLFQEKAMSFNYFGFMPHPRIEIGLFESVIWKRWDESGNVPFDYRSVIPVIGLNTLLLGYGEENKVVNGAQANIKVSRSFHLYGQIMYDGKKAWQGGIKIIEPFVKNLEFQLEYNEAEAGTYSNSVSLQNYSHMNQSLAHPLGSAFSEYVIRGSYRWKRIMFNAHYVYQIHDKGMAGDIFEDYDDSFDELIPNEASTHWLELEAKYLMNAFYNFEIFSSLLAREQNINSSWNHSLIFKAGIRSNIYNKYRDF